MAKLHFTIESQPSQWFEGFQSIERGLYSPYQSHRSGENRDSAYVVRTSGSEAMIEWTTSEISNSVIGDSVSFLWVCGFGNNLGTELFDLFIDGDSVVTFSTKSDSYWNKFGKNGIQLSFITVYQNSNGANFGYMVLTLSSSALSEKKTLRIRIQARSSANEIWYRLFAYKDALKFAIENERKDYFSNVQFIHMGDALLTLCTLAKNDNSLVQLFTSNTLIAEGRLQTDGVISKVHISIPRNHQPVDSTNTIIKVDNKSIDSIYWNEINKQRVFAFMDEELVSDKYVFPSGEFPKFKWKNEILVENELGKFSLNVTYYNSDFQKVNFAEIHGRYGAVIDGVTPTGFRINRYVTLFCSDVEFDDYSKNVPIKINKFKEYEITGEAWQQYENNLERFSFGSLKYFPWYDSDAAILLAGMKDLNNPFSNYDTPRNRDRQWWITLKAKLDRQNRISNLLSLPEKIDKNFFPFINDSVQLPSSDNKDPIDRIKNLCADWAVTGDVPNVTLIVHNGKIIFYEAFGLDENGNAIKTDSKIWMASITKLLTGVLMMQFIEQGIISLDDPVSKYLSELGGNDKLTIRHLFTHTSGLDFAGEWASDWNVSLENQVAQILPLVDVGKTFSYHKVGYAIVGKIVERLTGKAIPYLFQDYIFSPLGMNSAYSDNTYGGLYCSSIDLAKFGQMLLNKGTYKGYKLFSQQTFEKMLPTKLNVGDRSWGIGTSLMEGIGLSESAFGHGAASGTVFIIDPENDLIIISARNKPGKSHDEFANRLIELCTSLVKK
ncbi:MAG: serine hydrolase domain-containing protein [Ignavibacteriota bacterium]